MYTNKLFEARTLLLLIYDCSFYNMDLYISISTEQVFLDKRFHSTCVTINNRVIYDHYVCVHIKMAL